MQGWGQLQSLDRPITGTCFQREVLTLHVISLSVDNLSGDSVCRWSAIVKVVFCQLLFGRQGGHFRLCVHRIYIAKGKKKAEGVFKLSLPNRMIFNSLGTGI